MRATKGAVETGLKMSVRILSTMFLAGALCALPSHAQDSGANDDAKRVSGVNIHRDGWDRVVPAAPANQPSEPAPIRDLTGVWEPTPGFRDGVFSSGPREYPADGKPEHELPFTALGLKTWKEHKPGQGAYAVPVAEDNDPFQICDPIGFPRIELFNLRAIRVFQTKSQVAIIYQNDQVWRTIWTDGRQLPKEILEPRWYGFSVGQWTDDYTFMVQTVGLDERTWIDNVGRPHSDELKITETWHRVNHDLLELTLTIEDPKMYTKPWTALNKFRMRLQPDWFDIHEMICSASEAQQYKQLADQADEQKKADSEKQK
jgi:hypothetical protein